MKIAKIFTIDIENVDWLQKQNINMSDFVNSLISKERSKTIKTQEIQDLENWENQAKQFKAEQEALQKKLQQDAEDFKRKNMTQEEKDKLRAELERKRKERERD